ncbi:hypothetical protein GJ496_005034 [Pomphorhynchus laevis]|nr:hypothetical protein GJ496_005034 [Pomphorhynchus laevis]
MLDHCSNSSTRISNRHDWSPYENHSGTITAVAGDDFVITASDTRLTDDSDTLISRNCPHVVQLNKNNLLLSTGFIGDADDLIKRMHANMTNFLHIHRKEMPTHAVASLLSSVLYGKRFFPYYVYNIVAGIDAQGKGVVYGYDPVGSYESLPYASGGPGSGLITPLLDSLVGQKNRISNDVKKFTIEELKMIIMDSYTSATERQVNVGDGLVICVMTSDGKIEMFIRQAILCIANNLCRLPKVRYISLSSRHFGLMDFFDNPANLGKTVITHGRPWSVSELRLKNNVDLHKLWYVLLKERNMLLTMEEFYRSEAHVFPSPERIDKVEESMDNISRVVEERDVAVNLLETGRTGLSLPYRRYNSMGLYQLYQQREHLVPWYINGSWKLRWHAPKRPEWSKYYQTCLLNTKSRKKKRLSKWIHWQCQEYYRKFPELKEDSESEQLIKDHLSRKYNYRQPMSAARIKYKPRPDEWVDDAIVAHDLNYDGNDRIKP